MGLSPKRGSRAGQQPPIANERLSRPASQMPRSSSSPDPATTLDLGGLRSSPVSETAAIRPCLSPRRKRPSATTTMSRQQPESSRVRSSSIGRNSSVGTGAGSPPVPVMPSRQDSATSQHGVPPPPSLKDRGSGSNPAVCPALSSWWVPGSRRPAVVLQSVLKKRAGRINSWADRFFVLTEMTLDQYAKGEDATCAEPKHSYELDLSCTCSEIKDSKSGGKPIYFFHVDWPSAGQSKEEGDDEISMHEEEDPEVEAGGGSNSNNLSTPPPRAQGTGTGTGPDLCSPAVSPMAMAESLSREDGWTIPSGHPRFDQSDSSCSLTGCMDATRNGHSAPLATSPKATAGRRRHRKRPSAANVGENEEPTRNETIEGMVAAQREQEKIFASFHREELQLSELEMEKKRRHHDKKGKKSKEDKRTMMSTNKAVAITAVTVSWVTAGVATGGLFIAGTLVAAGITATVGSMGAYSKYKNKSQNGAPSRLRLGSDKLEVVQQWRAAILKQILKLREQPSPGKEAGPWMGRGFGALWAARPPEGLPPALKAIDLRVLDDMLSNASWTSRGVMQGLPILEQEVGLGGEAAGAAGNGGVSSGTGWGLGGSGPILKTQTIVRASPLETFVALMGAPKHSMNAVISGTFTVHSLDDHSDVVRLCLRPAWLRVAWASPRDFCLARYWHMSEDGCYIVTLSSMEHPLCPMDPAFVRGEAQLVYTISPRRESLPVPGGHASPECLLCCHVQVNPKGWIWNRLGMRELYTSQILMHVLEVRNVIEAERFVAPRLNLLRPESCPTSDGTPTGGGARPRSLDSRSFPFEVLGAQESEGGGRQGGRGCEGRRGGRGPPRGCSWSSSWCSLERDPPPALDPRMWTEADATEFSVRGPSYLSTKAKVPSAKQMFRLRAVDLFSVSEPVTHLAQHPANRIQIARKAGEKSFIWVLQLMVPGPPHYAFVAYFTPGTDNWRDTSTPFGKLASRVFFGDDDDFRDQRLKLIPKIVEGNWVVKRAAGTTPAILGTKLRQHHFKGDNYLETDLEIASSSIAANITRLCVGYAKSLVVDMVWTIQGNTEEELPEVALAGVRLNHLDFLAAKPLDLSSLQSVASLVPESESTAARHHSRRD